MISYRNCYSVVSYRDIYYSFSTDDGMVNVPKLCLEGEGAFSAESPKASCYGHELFPFTPIRFWGILSYVVNCNCYFHHRRNVSVFASTFRSLILDPI